MKRQVIGGTRTRIWGIVKTVILFALLLVYMVPFFMVIINAFKTNRTILKEPLKLLEPGGPIFTNFSYAFDKMARLFQFAVHHGAQRAADCDHHLHDRLFLRAGGLEN